MHIVSIVETIILLQKTSYTSLLLSEVITFLTEFFKDITYWILCGISRFISTILYIILNQFVQNNFYNEFVIVLLLLRTKYSVKKVLPMKADSSSIFSLSNHNFGKFSKICTLCIRRFQTCNGS